MEFNEAYTNYWSLAVQESIDGTKVAGTSEIRKYLNQILIKQTDYVCDLGCSFGRMYELLATYTDHVFGVDPESSAVQKARLLGYKKVVEGSAEATTMPDKYFDLVFSWAVFDVVNQKKALQEANRILKVGGRLFFTGKNDNYFPDDRLAFIAEKNAFLKEFPNRFTNLPRLLNYLTHSGFNLDLLYLFPRRGDMGIDVFEVHTDHASSTLAGYEYLISCTKRLDIATIPHFDSGEIDMESSKTADNLARLAGFSNCHDYFYSLGLESN